MAPGPGRVSSGLSGKGQGSAQGEDRGGNAQWEGSRKKYKVLKENGLE